jgi:phospholipid/cholesterol/gamma-HCH transport system ATP-binding protein
MTEKQSPRGSDQTMILVKEVYKSFGPKQVLRGLNLEVKCGESMVVIGGSGTGKSVLIKCIIGLLHHDQGEIYVEGKEISNLNEKEWNELRKKFGMLFQRDALFDSMSVWENVGFGLRQHTRLTDEEIKATAIEKLKLVGLQNVENLMPSELSGGMRKRVSLARAIAMEPAILLYDEPTTGLDPIMANVINELIVEMREKLDVTSIAITHDMVSAYRIADRIAMLFKGAIIEVGTPDDIKTSTNEIVQQFIHGEVQGPITRGADLGHQIFNHRGGKP